MDLIMADEVEEFQVVQPVILAIAVFVMDFCLIIHGEEELAVRTSSTLMFQEFSSGCVQSDVRSFSCAVWSKKSERIALKEVTNQL